LVALSTAEAEYIAACEATKEAFFLREILRDMGHEQINATTLLEDNQACIAIAENAGLTSRNKHIRVRYHFTREALQDKVIQFEHVPTDDQIADGLTKNLGAKKHRLFRDAVVAEISPQHAAFEAEC